MANIATSIYFDGNADFLTFPSSPDLNFTTGESWVFEAWILQDSGGGANPVIYNAFGTDDNANSAGDHYLYFNTSNRKFYWGGVGIPSGSEWDSGALIHPVGQWGHYAFQFSGTNACIYVDGVLVKFAENATSAITATSGAFKIGDDSNINYFKGWMDALRVSKVARYGNIDIPTTQLKTWQAAGRGQNALLPHHTKLLIQANSTTTTSSTIVDQSAFGHTVTASGAVHSQGDPIFGNTAIWFDGTNDYLSVTNDGAGGDFDVSDGQDWSYECWFKRTDTSAGNHAHFWSVSSDSADGVYITYRDGATDIQFGSWNGTDVSVYVELGAHPVGWHHLAAGKVAGMNCIWYDGQLRDAAAQASGPEFNGTDQIYIGRGAGPSWNSQYFEGYMDGIRFCKGQAAYTPNFIPYGGQKNVAVSRGGAVTDARHPSANTHAIRMGQAINSTNANTYCLDFDGSADYLHRNVVSDWRSSDSQGTIFAWVYIDSAGVNTIFSSGGGNVITNGDFSNGVDGWTGAGYETLSNEGSGQSGNCLGITRVADSYQYVHHSFPTVSGVAYTFSAYVKTGSGDNVGYNIYVGTGPGNNSLSGSNTGTASSSWVQVTDTFTATGSYAVINLVRGASTAAGRMDFDTVRCYPTDERRFQVLVDASSKLGIHQENNDTVDDLYTAGSVATAGWHSVAIVSSGTAYTAYIDGVASSLSATTGTSSGDWLSDTINRNNLFIGTHNDKNTSGAPANLFNGKIMQVAYWGGASGTTGVLDADAIAALHAAGKGYDIKGSGNTGNYDSWAADLKGYWRMGNHYLDTPITIYDASGNGYDMHQVSNPSALTWSTGTTFLEGWQDRGFFTGDKYTSLLIQSAHANGSTTFTDSGSGFKKTIFDGTDDYALKSVAAWDGTSTRGTVVAWVKSDTIAGDDTIFSSADSSGATTYIKFQTAAGKLSIEQKNNDTVDEIQGSVAISVGVWNCLAWQSTGTGYNLYVNGVAETLEVPVTGTNSGDWFSDTSAAARDNIVIGASVNPSASDFFDGQVAQVAVWGGASGTTGVLTASEISTINDLGPGADLTTAYSTGMVGYWTFGNKIAEGADVAATIYDQSAGSDDNLTTSGTMAVPFAQHTITRTGAIHKTDKSVYGGSSIYFDGSNDYLATPAGGEWNLPLGTSFTIELWMNCANPTTSWTRVMTQNSGTNVGWALHFDSTSGGIQFGSDSISIDTTDDLFDTTVIAANVWYHVAVSYDADANAIGLYVDGIEANYKSAYNATQPIKNWWTQTVGGEVYIGRRTGSPGYYYQGYMDEIRISSGVARYSKSIERFANTFVAKGDTGDAFTLMQVQSNGSKSGTALSSVNFSGTTSGQAIVQGELNWTSVKSDPYGGSNTVISTIGTNSHLKIPHQGQWNALTTLDWTYEFWWACEIDGNGTSSRWFISGYDDFFIALAYSHGSSTANKLEMWASSNGTSWNIFGDSGVTAYSNQAIFGDGNWRHIIWQRKGSAFQIYIDGVLDITFISTASITTDPGAGAALMAHDSGGFGALNGDFVDGIRFSKGIARYGGVSLRTTQQVVTSSNSDSQVVTSNSTFGSGTNLFTADANTAILLQGNSLTADEAPIPNVVTNNNGVVLRQGVSAFGANSYYFDGTNDYLTVSSGASPADSADILATDTWRDDGFCVEMWMKPTAVGTHGVFQAIRVDGSNRLHMRFHNTHGFVVSFDSASGQVELVDANNDEFCKGLINTWYHCAVQITSASARNQQQLQLWINGNLYLSLSMSDKHFDASGGVSSTFGYDSSNYYAGYMDQIRVSTKPRLSYTGANIKAGLSAVHHSHCKLLITSNTYSGNTHFDDFSDQGNYWNQTPYNFSADRDMSISTENTVERNALTTFSFSFWFNPIQLTACTLSSGLEGADSADYGTGFRIQLATTGIITITTVANGGAANALASTHKLHAGEWHLITYTNSGTSGTDHLKCFIDGQLSATSSTAASATTDINYWYLLSERNNGTTAAFCRGKMSAAAVWNSTLTAAEVLELWERGPAQSTDWTNNSPNYSSAGGLIGYYAFGNHNDVGGRPADKTHVSNSVPAMFDRSGVNKDCYVYDGTSAFNHGFQKGTLILPVGTVKHSTDIKNFGSSAIYFSGANGTYLQPTPGRAEFASGADWTFEAWLMILDSEATRLIYDDRVTGSGRAHFYINASGGLVGPGVSGALGHSVGDWFHLVHQHRGVTSEVFFNGILKTTGSFAVAEFFGTSGVRIGANSGGNETWYGYMDEIGFYAGAKYNSVALPGKATITPSYLADPSGNHFTTSGLTVTDQMLDTPENNFCTLNPLDKQHDAVFTFTEGNLVGTADQPASQFKQVFCTQGRSSGKWYFEFSYDPTASNQGKIGIAADDTTVYTTKEISDVSIANVAAIRALYPTTAAKRVDESTDEDGVASGMPIPEFTGITTWAIAFDLDNGKIYYFQDGVEWSGQDINAGSALGPLLDTTKNYIPFIDIGDGGSGNKRGIFTMNFGQGDRDGENNFTDSGGIGGFRYEPPAGFLSICTKNMSDRDYAPIGPNSSAGNPDQHFDTVLWTGDATADRRIAGLNFQPDLVWLKSMSNATSHGWFDSVRGVNQRLVSNSTAAEDTQSMLTSFNADGFNTGDHHNNSGTHVAWCWKAGNGSVVNTDGTIQSTVSVNQDAGFSIVSWNGNGVAATVGHGLSKIPDLYITKNREAGSSPWVTWHKDMDSAFGSSGAYMYLDSTGADSTTTVFYDGTKISSSVVGYLGGNANVNGSGVNYIAYAWHSVEGYSKFGRYEGNGNANGPFIYTGFKPAMLIIKSIDAAWSWTLYDNKRNPTNTSTTVHLNPDHVRVQGGGDGANTLDFLSNGFKLRSVTNSEPTNVNDKTFIYMAWAEMPMKYSNAR